MSARKPRVPGYRPHSSGQARVTLDGKDHLLGPYDSAQSKEAYRRLVAEYMGRRGRLAPPPPDTSAPLSVNELLLAYYKQAAASLDFAADRWRGDAACLRDALRVVKELYGSTPAKDFGPLALKACRARMVERGWSRTYVNAQVGRVRRAFRWAVGEELAPPSVFEALRAVDGLRRGKGARETEKVRPAPVADVVAALPHLPPPVAAMVRVHLLTGMRAGEVMALRDADIDTSGEVWVYRPHRHKNTHRGRDRVIFLGPKAQEALRPWLPVACPACGARDLPGRLGWTGALCAACHDRREGGAAPSARAVAPAAAPPPRYVFSPRACVEALHARRAAARKTRRTPSELKKTRQDRPRVAPGERYTRRSYRLAVWRACKKAGVTPWSPLQLRHAAATLIRARYGVEGAQGVLGHSRVETSQIYAERLLGEASRIMGEVG